MMKKSFENGEEDRKVFNASMERNQKIMDGLFAVITGQPPPPP